VAPVLAPAILVILVLFVRGIAPTGAPTAMAAAGTSVLTLGWEAEPRTFDPRYAVDANSQYLENLLHCSLIDFDRDGHTIPVLAKSWAWTTPTVLTVDLNAKARFADGAPVTADDVVATYQFFKNDKAATPSPRRGAFAKVKSVTAKGPSTVVFELSEPDSAFVANLVVGILPAKLAGGDMLTEAQPVAGCGPFKLKGVSAAGIELEANPNYALGAPPKVSGVTFKVVKDENTRYAKLAAGELDVVQNLLNRDKLGEIAKSNPKLAILRRPGLNTTYLGFNMRDKVVGNPLVRQAIARAIDKQKIIKYVLSGMAVPADTLLPDGDPYHAKTLKAPAYDPEAAKALLDQAGFKAGDGGKRLSLSFKTTTDLTRVAVAKAIAAELKKVGIDVTVETLEWGRFKADVEGGKAQMWSLSWIGFKDPDIYRFAFATESFPPGGGNRGWYSNPALDKLLADGKAETDPAKRAAIYAKAEQLIADDDPYVFLWHEEVFAVVNKSVEGFEVYADGRLSSLANAVKK
jgi:peptide/nickel transport system substrate-binding protein